MCAFHCHDVLKLSSSAVGQQEKYSYLELHKLISNSHKLCKQDLMDEVHLLQYRWDDDLWRNKSANECYTRACRIYNDILTCYFLEALKEAQNTYGAISQCFSTRLSIQHGGEPSWHLPQYRQGSALSFCVGQKCTESRISFRHVLNIIEMRWLIELLSAQPTWLKESRRVECECLLHINPEACKCHQSISIQYSPNCFTD